MTTIINNLDYIRQISYLNKQYDLRCFAPIKRKFSLGNKVVPVKFNFSTHIFSRKAPKDYDIIDNTKRFKENNHRAFDLARYENAKTILNGFIANKIDIDWNIIKGKKDDYILIRKNYKICFRFIKRKKHIEIFITTAHMTRTKQPYTKSHNKSLQYKLCDKLDSLWQ